MQDGIQTEITVNAPIERVWDALTDYRQFGAWFRLALTGPFALGAVTEGRKTEPGHEEHPFWAVAVAMEVPTLFAFDWPSTSEVTPELRGPGRTTRVEFRLEATPGGTRISLSEAGFAALPPGLASHKLRDNATGWDIRCERIRAYVDG